MSARKKLPYVVLGIVALAPGIVASCGSNSDSAVIVHVTGPTTLPAVFRIHSILSNDETSDSKLFPMTAPAQAIAIPTAFSITLPRARSGELDVALDALDATGDILANGAGSTTINAGGTAEVTIALSLGISLCGNGQIDPGEQCDDGDRITNGTCDYRCQKHVVVRGNDGGSSDAIDGGMGTGGAGAGGKGGAGGGGAGAGGKLGTGGTGAGGAGLGGMTGAGGRGMGGSGAGGSGVGGGSGGCAIELLSNGTFDDGPIGWSFTSPVNTVMIYSSGDPALGGVSPASGTGVALLGRNLVNNGGSTTPAQETMAQVISVPSAANTITIQGLVQIPTATTTCTTCNSVAAEIVHNPTNISVKSWTAGDGTGAWMGFGTTIDATPLRGTTVLFQLRAVATTTNVVPFYFDSLSAKVDKCGP